MASPSRLLVAASVAALTLFSAGAAPAQGTANTGTGTTAAPATTTTTTAAPEAATADKGKPAPKQKKKQARETRQQEIDRSIDQGTVPARYRRQVPREYQQYIPFDKR
ncbi:MAG: hypothetical protein PS018_21250 [bacterium]|nr:hypothetical protein [bacterium]